MPLPDVIEIIPPTGPITANITVPGSKSITNRALVLAALADGEVTLEGALWSEDTQVMVECLTKFGFKVDVQPDPDEDCNRTIRVEGLGGRIPEGGSPEQPLELFVGNAGTAARFLAAMVCLGRGSYRLSGIPRMHERPQAALFASLRQLGYRIDTPNDCLPAVIHGTGPRAAQCEVSIEKSSQFASALLLCGWHSEWRVDIVGDNEEQSPYVRMTRELMAGFPRGGGGSRIETDTSSGSYFRAAAHILRGSNIEVRNWPVTDWQIDTAFPNFLPLPEFVSRRTDLGDSIMTAIAIAPLAGRTIRFTDLGRLRVQECERVEALRTELTKCGAKVIEEGDTLTVHPSELHGAKIETYNDHRMAMCFATLGLKVPGIRIKNPACVKKTFPNFFQKLAAEPSNGLGVDMFAVGLVGEIGESISSRELFAQ